MIQTRWVVERLQEQWPDLEIIIEQISTKGDHIRDKPLTEIGGDGVFVKEIEHGLHRRRIDLAVHSLKDLPIVQPADLHIAVVGPREDVRDVMVSNVSSIPPHFPYQANANLRIGTCSLRRAAQMRALLPNAQLLPLRGNVDTRLRKLEAGEYDAIVLAAAGLHRLALQERLADRIIYLPVDVMMPAPGQGALALEMRSEEEIQTLIASLENEVIQAATGAERMFMRRLGAGCYLPVAAYGEIVNGMLTLQGLVISLDGQRQVRVQYSTCWTSRSTIEDAEQLGVQLAEQALAQGAAEIIAALAIDRIQESRYV
jgi:hydroxymethylbilane synthase